MGTLAKIVCLVLLSAAPALAAPSPPSPLGYGGRLSDATGAPLAGPVDLSLRFYRTATGGTSLLAAPVAFPDTPLVDGVFQIRLALSPADFGTVFADVAEPVYVEVTDATHHKTYPRQQFLMVPYAAKVPVDGQTITYNGLGQLTAGSSNVATDPTGLTAADKGKTWFNTATNQLKYWDGSTVQIVSAGTSGVGSIPLASGSGVTAGLLSNADYTAFQGKVSRGGDAMSGSLGIGTTSPRQLLHVYKSSGYASAIVSESLTGNAGVALTAGSKTWALFTTDTYDYLQFWSATANANAMSLSPAGGLNLGSYVSLPPPAGGLIAPGKVGIGTSSPASALGVDGDISLNFNKLDFGGQAGDHYYQLWVTPNTLNLSAYNDVVFSDHVGERMRIASGNVGIGTTTPGALLDVNGAVAARGGLSVAGGNQVQTTSDLGSTSLWTAASTAWHAGRGMIYGPALDVFADGNAGPGEIRFYTDTPGTWVDVPKVVFAANGRVGIGTTTPGQQLSVAGTVESTTGGFRFPDGTTQTTAAGAGAAGSAYAMVYRTTSYTITPINTWYDLAFDAEQAKSGLTHSNVTNPEQVTATTAGVYRISYDLNLTSSGGGTAFIRLTRNGTEIAGTFHTVSPLSSGSGFFSGTAIVSLAANDYVTLQVGNNQLGINVNVRTGDGPAPTTASTAAMVVERIQ